MKRFMEKSINDFSKENHIGLYLTTTCNINLLGKIIFISLS